MGLELSELVGWADNVMALVSDIGEIAAAGKSGDAGAVKDAVMQLIDHAQEFADEIITDIQD